MWVYLLLPSLPLNELCTSAVIRDLSRLCRIDVYKVEKSHVTRSKDDNGLVESLTVHMLLAPLRLVLVLLYQRFFAYICNVIKWRSISMRARPASLQFDWSKAGLSMDSLIFVYSNKRNSLNFLSTQGRCRTAFYVVTTSNFAESTLQSSCFFLDLSLSRSTDHQDRN